jgi:transcriptional antiterminator NusG
LAHATPASGKLVQRLSIAKRAMNDPHTPESDENAKVNDSGAPPAPSTTTGNEPPSADSADVPPPEAGLESEPVAAWQPASTSEAAHEPIEAESPGAEASKPEEPPALPAHEIEAPALEPAPASEVEAKPAPKPRKPRKPKAAASGAYGPAAAPASTDPNAPPAAGGAESAAEGGKKWYVVKVQSGREDSIKSAIERKVKIEGLEQYFGQIAIPVEEIVVKKSVKVKDKKTGDKVTQEKKVVKHQKKYPGYLFAEVEFNDRILFLFRDTSGVGDFVGAGLKREPTPMTDREVTQMLTGVVEPGAKGKGLKGPVKVKLDIEKGDKVKIRDGAFANMEGEVKAISEAKEEGETPKVTVVVTIFGRPVEVELDYWHVDKV